MLLPNDQLPKSFAIAKRLALIAVAMTPLIPIAAAVRQSANGVLFGFCSLVFVPIMALAGYGVCRLARLLSSREHEAPRTFFPSDWPLPFRLLNVAHRWQHHPPFVAARSTFLNMFVILWCAFLLVWVAGAVVVMITQPEAFLDYAPPNHQFGFCKNLTSTLPPPI